MTDFCHAFIKYFSVLFSEMYRHYYNVKCKADDTLGNFLSSVAGRLLGNVGVNGQPDKTQGPWSI